MRTPILAGASFLAIALALPALASADPQISYEGSVSFPESDRGAARREATRSAPRQQAPRQTRRSGGQNRSRSAPPPVSGGDQPIYVQPPQMANHGDNGRGRDQNGRGRDRDRDQNGRGRDRDRDHNGRGRDRNRDHNGRGRDRDRNRHSYRDNHRRNRSHSSFSLYLGNSGYGSGYGYGSRYGSGRSYGSGLSYSFLGGNYYQSGYDLYPWWYGRSDYGYRTRSGYGAGYGHVGHSNVYCSDPSHERYGVNWNGSRYNDQYFSNYSETTNGSYGGYAINSCHLETKRGHFGNRRATVKVTVCWDDNARRYTETGAVQLINYY